MINHTQIIVRSTNQVGERGGGRERATPFIKSLLGIIGGSCHEYDFCRNKAFVATKITLVAVPANDNWVPQLPPLPPPPSPCSPSTQEPIPIERERESFHKELIGCINSPPPLPPRAESNFWPTLLNREQMSYQKPDPS